VKLRFLILILLLAGITLPAMPQQAPQPLTKGEVMDLVKFGMSSADVVEKIKKLSIDFEPTDDYLQALRNAGAEDVVIQALRAARPKPLSRDQVGQLVAGGVPVERAAALVKQRGIDFVADEEYLRSLRLAGADDALIAALREASARVTAELVVTTSPNAEVYLEGELVGKANAQGELAVKARPGAHTLKVSLKGKKDFEQSVTLAVRQITRIEAALVDAPGSIRVRTLAGASIALDGASRGSADASGELALTDVPPGSHHLRVTAQGKKDYEQTVSVPPGQETEVEARLEDLAPSRGAARENPRDGLKYVWIPPGSFKMGCSPGDSECYPSEKPPHQVTITKGFWLAQTLVTVGAYKRFAAATGRQMPPAPDFNAGWNNQDMPIVNVTWDDATAFCGWAGGRLPTEAEWEYGARAGSTEPRYGPIDEVAWYANNSGSVRTHEVGQKRANGFGLYDVLGNVEEWVNDWYDGNYYQNSPSQDPSGPASGEYRVKRGGSWFDFNPRLVRVSARNYARPANRSGFTGGFRCGGEVFAP